MPGTWIYILAVLLLSCSSNRHNNVEINVFFRHSFARPLNFKIEKTNEQAKAFVEVLEYRKFIDSLTMVRDDSAVLSKKELDRFLDILGHTSLLDLRSDSSGIGDADGGETYFSITVDTEKNDFVVGDAATLHKNNVYERLINAVFYLLYTKFPAIEESIEQNHRYYPHDFPVKVRGLHPRQIRLWGKYFENDAALLSKLLKDIPEKEPIIIDVSNIQSFGYIESVLLDFQKAHSKMVWVIGEVQQGERDYEWSFYKRSGLDTARMFADTIQAKEYLFRNGYGH
jgi:hypothetical protein